MLIDFRLLTVSFCFTTIVPSVVLLSTTYKLFLIETIFKLLESAELSTSIPSLVRPVFSLYAYTIAFHVADMSIARTYIFPCDTVIIGVPNFIVVSIFSNFSPSYITIRILSLL